MKEFTILKEMFKKCIRFFILEFPYCHSLFNFSNTPFEYEAFNCYSWICLHFIQIYINDLNVLRKNRKYRTSWTFLLKPSFLKSIQLFPKNVRGVTKTVSYWNSSKILNFCDFFVCVPPSLFEFRLKVIFFYSHPTIETIIISKQF